MYKATTPTHTFTLPFNVTLISKLLLTYKQDNVVINFDEDDVTMSNKQVVVTLTQEQTKMFVPGLNVQVQMRIKTTSDSVLASNTIELKVRNVLNDTEFTI